ncbi:MAG: DUF362 domain-containing protein [Oscillospiraceae bacterium]|nr:DUF362 domain-containing protein [Oscillospiraceae bacterium]
MNRPVYLADCPSYTETAVQSAVDAIFTSLSLDRLIQPGMQVVIKPNLVMKSKPEAAIITHPMVVAAVGKRVKALGARVLIAESAGGPYNPVALKSTYSVCGYETMARECGFDLNLDCGYRSVEAPHGVQCKAFPIIDPIANADLLIDIAKLKSHCLTGMSGAVKNLFGSVPGLMKPEFHCRFPDKQDFGRMLTDLCETVKPRISIVDGITAMEGNVPSGGQPRHMGVLLGGENPYNVDLIGAKLISMEPSKIFMLQSAMERGLCPARAEDVPLLGDPLEQHIVKDFVQPESKSNDFIDRVPKLFRPLAEKLATPRPKIRTKDCGGCGKCAESCPQHTIEIIDRKAVIHYNQCIKCFCCHEMCPSKAIDIKRFTLFNL